MSRAATFDVGVRIAHLSNLQHDAIEAARGDNPLSLAEEGDREWTDKESFAFGFGFLLDVAAKCKDPTHDQPTFAREFRAAVAPTPIPIPRIEDIPQEERVLQSLQSAAAILMET